MKIQFNKTKIATISLVLTLTFAATLVALPIVSAHDPPWIMPTWCYIDVSPDPIGVGQEAVIIFWPDKLPQTASGAYGDRFTWTIEVTEPDGSKETFGPITSDPVGGGWLLYTPDQVGTYTFVAYFPEHTYTGLPLPPNVSVNEIWGAEYVNDTLLSSTSDPATLTVQEEPVVPFEGAPLPTNTYWDRPIYPTNREWVQIGGNWLADGTGNLYTTAPKTSHVVWAKPIQFGGLAGVSDISYYTGSAYEQMWYKTPIIIGGKLYYNTPSPPRYGWYCVDLRTGEDVWFQNSTGPLLRGNEAVRGHIGPLEVPWEYPRLWFGQVYDYESPNQHGAVAYLWSAYPDAKGSTYTYEMRNGSTFSFDAPSGSTVWDMYDAFTGNYICSIANVPGGTQVTDSDGSILIYTYDARNGWLSVWNSSEALAFPNNNLEIPFEAYGAGEAYYWMWRPPLGRTVDGRNGYSSNITVPTNLGSISAVLEDRIIGSTSFGRYGTNAYSVWCLSLKPGEEGQLMWKKDYTAPPVLNATLSMGPASLEDGVFTMIMKETRTWYGYDIDTGDLLWGPSESQPAFDMYGLRGSQIAYGKLFSAGHAGILHCYDVETGALLWKSNTNPCGLESAYPYWPLGSGAGITIADHKIYLTTGEHSTTQPLYRGWSIYCFDDETGKCLWNFTGLMPPLAIADGYAVSLDGMDNRIYCFGKGQTETTVTASPKVSSKGNTILIEGTVTDQSPGAKGTPAVADEYMTEWMEYLYHQGQCPESYTGVPVRLEAFGEDGSYNDIGWVTSDPYGNFKSAWTPPDEGLYTIMATFAGSDSYWSSYAATGLSVGPAEAPSGPIEPEPTEPTEAPFITTEIAIIIAVFVVAVVGVVAFWALRKRK